MNKLTNLEPKSVFAFFEEISHIPRGSGNMGKIADYCVDFAKKRGLRFFRDDEDNVIIYKSATKGCEDLDPVILQGHLDIVCQKTPERDIDFENEGLDIYKDCDYVKARGTTLGADNGIAVAMMLAILDSSDISHPPIEAVFTTDEEIGMIGATRLDMSKLSGKRMINLDSEEDDTVIVSCAGGSDFKISVPLTRKTVFGTEICLTLQGLMGGHSGVEINKGRTNANILAGNLLNHIKDMCDFGLISIVGGDKGNAIPLRSDILVCTNDPDRFIAAAEGFLLAISEDMRRREPDFCYDIKPQGEKECSVLADDIKDKIIRALMLLPDGVQKMSEEIDSLVETSLNLGILKTDDDNILFHHTLRSNKSDSLTALEEQLAAICQDLGFSYSASGHYPPWEYKEISPLRDAFTTIYKNHTGETPKIEAIHAGLECAVFASSIEGVDCISIGPALYDVHTVNERLFIPSVEKVYNILLDILKSLK